MVTILAALAAGEKGGSLAEIRFFWVWKFGRRELALSPRQATMSYQRLLKTLRKKGLPEAACAHALGIRSIACGDASRLRRLGVHPPLQPAPLRPGASPHGAPAAASGRDQQGLTIFDFQILDFGLAGVSCVERTLKDCRAGVSACGCTGTSGLTKGSCTLMGIPPRRSISISPTSTWRASTWRRETKIVLVRFCNNGSPAIPTTPWQRACLRNLAASPSRRWGSDLVPAGVNLNAPAHLPRAINDSRVAWTPQSDRC